MSESEFDIIKTYFTHIGESPDWLDTGIGDDAAILHTHPQEQLLISIDTLNAGVHFADDTPPENIAYKALAVNISDIAAMGGQPTWFTLALSLPEVDHGWLKNFCSGLLEVATKYNLKLIGGDTTRGPLSITIQIAGVVPKGKALYRSGAETGNDIYVTGTLGDAAAGLILQQQHLKGYNSQQQILIKSLHRPSPRVEVGRALRELVTACIDVSDGLAGDLGHILEASSTSENRLGAELNLTLIPLSESLQQSGLGLDMQNELALQGGDDYELCFTAPPSEQTAIETISQQADCRISKIGTTILEPGLFIIDKGQRKAIMKKGFDHFGAA